MTIVKRAGYKNMTKASVDSTYSLDIFNDEDQNRDDDMGDENPTDLDFSWYKPPSPPRPIRIYNFPDRQEIIKFTSSLRNEYFTRHLIQWWDLMHMNEPTRSRKVMDIK